MVFFRVERSLEIFSRTFCRFVIEVVLHASFEYFSHTVVQHIFSNKHC